MAAAALQYRNPGSRPERPDAVFGGTAVLFRRTGGLELELEQELRTR